MDGETAANFSSCLSDIMVVKVYGKPEASSTSGTREHSSRYHRKHKKRWREHPEECPAEINSMSEEEVYDGIRSCTFLDTEIPGEAREKFVKRLKKKRKINRKK